MEHDELRELSAAYALDALEEPERREYERHLATCERCRDELGSLSRAATALAFATEAPPPPARLRARILEAATAERPLAPVIPLRRRRPFQLAVAAAAVAACTAIGLGVWASSLLNDRNANRAALQLVDLSGHHGTLIVSPNGSAALALAGVGAAPSGKTYEIWVIHDAPPKPAGLFGGGEAAVRVTRKVPRGATVAVTLEPSGGSKQPTSKPLFSAQTA
jgi:anti-sigma-K factor RskA